MDNREPKIQAMSKTEVANAYNVSLKTLASWIKPHKDKIGRYLGRAFTPKQIRIIFNLLGEP